MLSITDIIRKLHSPSTEDVALIKRAHETAAKAHINHKRYSGEPYITHVIAVADMLAEMGFGPRTISAALLHDTIEDTDITVEDIQKEFGDEILFLVEGVTKLGSVRYYGSDRHNESLRKLFVATSQDIRVLIIKLVDRLHNMQTLEFVPEEKQERIARETLEIYVAVAHRLGMGRIRKELEDLAFPYVYKNEYNRVIELTKPIRKRGEEMLTKSRKSLQKKLAEVKVRNFHTFCRVKGMYSLFKKLERRDWDMDKIYDYLAIRVVVNDVEECYRVLGIIHELWRPLPKRMKDYIAFPKPNGYQSIHTTVITPGSAILEIQIRTEKMHREAEFGVASHIVYKNIQTGDKSFTSQNKSWFPALVPSLFRPFAWRTTQNTELSEKEIMAEQSHKVRIPKWINEIGESHDTSDNAGEFIDNLKRDFFTYRIFVFTPEGDVIDLPTGATAIDFAYAIHSEIGDHTSATKINSKFVGLDTELKNGDIVEIITKESNSPTTKWLKFAKTTLAKRRIRSAIAVQENTIRKNS